MADHTDNHRLTVPTVAKNANVTDTTAIKTILRNPDLAGDGITDSEPKFVNCRMDR